MTIPHSPNRLARDLRQLGLREGDTVLLRAAVRALGPAEGRAADTLIDATMQVIGEGGTLLALAFSESAFFLKKQGSPVFRPDSPVQTGGFAAAVLARPGAVRSAHPTNSFVALGGRAAQLLADHDHTTTSFHPLRQLLGIRGKMVLVGCVSSSPGFSTVHLAQEDLGLATRSLISGLYGAYHVHEGEIRWFRRRDVSGCSSGFGKFYAHYVSHEQLSAGLVGDAYSLLIDCASAYEIEKRILARDPRFALCDRDDCSTCRGSRLYNKRDIPVYAVRFGLARIWHRVRGG